MPGRMLLVVLSLLALLVHYPGEVLADGLFDAAASGDVAVLDRGLQDNPGLLNATDSAGQTALHLAIARKQIAAMELLLKRGADYRIKDGQGRSAMALAVESGSETLAERFLLNIPDVDLPEAVRQGDVDVVRLVLLGDPWVIYGRLQYDNDIIYNMAVAAIEHRRFEFIKLILASRPESERTKSFKGTVTSRLCTAAWKGETGLLRDYIAAGNDINLVDETWSGSPLHQAAAAGNRDLVRMLLDAGAKVNLNCKGWTALHAAAWHGDREIVEMLLAAGAEIDMAQSWGWRPIHNALWQNHFEIVRLLEERGAKSDAWLAAGMGRTDEALRLIEQLKGKPPVDGPPPVFWAARCGRLDTLKKLWKDDSLVRVELDHEFHQLQGATLLHVAAEAGQVEVMRWLIERGAPISAAGATATDHWLSGMTPLHMAAAAGQIEAAKVLFDAGMNIEGTTQKSSLSGGPTHSAYTPLLVAVAEGKKEMVEFLLDRGADIEAAATAQATALSIAASQGHRKLCELLLARGAKINGKTDGNPLLAAVGSCWRRDPEIVAFLLDHGADVNAGADDGHSILLEALNVRQSDRDENWQNILKLLLDRGPALDAIVPRQDTSLLLAAVKARNVELVRSALRLGKLAQEKDIDKLLIAAGHYGNVETMNLLVAAGLKFRSSKESKHWENGMKTVFDGAIQSGRKDMVRFLIENGCDPNANTDSDELMPLCLAVRAEHKLAAIVLLEAGAKPNLANRSGHERALDIAAEKGRCDLIRLLLAHDAALDVNPNGMKGSLTIYKAAYGGCIAALDLLLDFDAGKTPEATALAMHTATSQGHVEMLRRLVARDININIRHEQGRTPLHTALYSPQLMGGVGEIPPLNKAAVVLLELGADPNLRDNDGMTPLQLAIVYNRKEFAEKLLARGAEVDVFSAAALGQLKTVIAAMADDPKRIHQLHWHGPPLVWAAAAGQTEIVKWLLERGADINGGRDPKVYRGLSPLSAGVRRGDCALVELLLDRGADPNAPNEDALQVAIGAGRVEIVKLLLDRKAAVNQPTRDGNDPFGAAKHSPLHMAAGRGYAEIAALLIQHGADIEIQDDKKRTPLDVATVHEPDSSFSYSYGRAQKDLPPSRRDLVTIRLLDAYQKQDKKPLQKTLDNALCWAAGQGEVDVVKRLLDAGANANARGQFERTSLVEAVFQFDNRCYTTRSERAEKHKQHAAVIKLLMARGADPNSGDRNSDALRFAGEYHEDKEFIELLSKPRDDAESGK